MAFIKAVVFIYILFLDSSIALAISEVLKLEALLVDKKAISDQFIDLNENIEPIGYKIYSLSDGGTPSSTIIP